MNSSAEDIILLNVNTLRRFIEEILGESPDEYIKHLHPWNETWIRIKNWLINSDEYLFKDKNTAIKAFVDDFIDKISPFRKIIDKYLDDSLYLHEEFWNLFFINILKARTILHEK